MKYRIKDYPELKETVAKMSMEDLFRTVICPDILIGKHELPRNTGSLLLHPVERERAAAASAEINDGRENRALLAADMEYGAGSAVKGSVRFPSMRAAAETGDETLAYRMGVCAAKEAILSGYHWTFAPCVDILGRHDNPIVSIRTAGEDADTVIKYGGAYMRGLQDTGLIATLKHFPGDGYCENDQHITTTENPLSRKEWDNSFGRVYKELIDQGVKSIMPGHIALPAYDEIDPDTGLYPPATVSKNLMTGLLRKKLGFEGIIISDAMNMTGFSGYVNTYDGIARFLEGGGDCLLFIHDTPELFTEMRKRIEDGKLSMATLRDRAYRMLCFSKEFFEGLANRPAITFDRAEGEKISDEMVDRSVKIVRDRHHLLPYRITKDTRIYHLVLYNAGTPDDNFRAVEDLTARLSEIAGKVDEVRDPGPGKALHAAKDGNYDLIICSVLNQYAWGMNCLKLSGPMARNMMGGWMRFNIPAFFISYYDPYFCEVFKACTDTVINTYGYTDRTNQAILRLLTEEQK